MYAKNMIAAGALLSVVAAVPMAKRDVVWVTETDEAIVTVPVTTTVWVNPGESAPTLTASHYGHHRSHSKITTHIKSTVTVPAPSAPATPSSVENPASSEAAPSSYEAPTTSSSVYVAPTPSSTSVYVAPTPSSSSFYVAPTTSTTSTWVAPTTSAAPATTEAPSSYEAPTSTAAATTSAAASGTSPDGSTYTGDITHYDVGLGSCGWTNNDSEDIVAIPHGMMNNGINPNNNPLCGKYITISYGGNTNTAKVVDTCGGCDGSSIDLSPTLFTKVAPNGDGRVHDVEWWFNN